MMEVSFQHDDCCCSTCWGPITRHASSTGKLPFEFLWFFFGLLHLEPLNWSIACDTYIVDSFNVRYLESDQLRQAHGE